MIVRGCQRHANSSPEEQGDKCQRELIPGACQSVLCGRGHRLHMRSSSVFQRLLNDWNKSRWVGTSIISWFRSLSVIGINVCCVYIEADHYNFWQMSHYLWIVTLKLKSNTLQCYKTFQTTIWLLKKDVSNDGQFDVSFRNLFQVLLPSVTGWINGVKFGAAFRSTTLPVRPSTLAQYYI
jgi:hypothetical protein